MKTNKSMVKRFKITKNKKIIKRTAGQAHFNAKERGNVRRNKRSNVVTSKTMRKIITTYIS